MVWRRDKSEEDNQVLLWLDDDSRSITASLVFPNGEVGDAEIRVTGGDIDRFRIPVSRSIALKMKPERMKRVVDLALRRRKERGRLYAKEN